MMNDDDVGWLCFFVGAGWWFGTGININTRYLYRDRETQQARSVGPTLGIPIPKIIPKVSMLCPCFRNFFPVSPSLCS
jgi:hypothetical protein